MSNKVIAHAAFEGKQSAFPDEYGSGLTKREYFAGLAMQGLYAGDRDNGFDAEGVAAYAVQTADALLKALEESNNE